MEKMILLFIVSLIASLFVIGLNCDEDEETDDLRLRLNAIKIVDLERRIEGFTVQLSKAKIAARSYARVISDIKYRLKKLEGTVCERNEFECGDDKYQCVSELLACDGYKDCRNGRDEDTKFCNTSGFSASTVYSSWSPITSCVRDAPKMSVFFTNYIIDVKRSKIFPPLLRTIQSRKRVVNGKSTSRMIAEGYIQLGTRRSVAYSKSGTGTHCQYVEDGFDRMYCDIYTRGSHTPCLKNVPVNRHFPYRYRRPII